MNQSVNLFTVRRTELPAERPIDWAHDFPGIIDLSAGGELVRDNRRRLTLDERRALRVNRAEINKAETRGALYGAFCAACLMSGVIAFVVQVI